jgi:hypothetical protein
MKVQAPDKSIQGGCDMRLKMTARASFFVFFTKYH